MRSVAGRQTALRFRSNPAVHRSENTTHWIRLVVLARLSYTLRMCKGILLLFLGGVLTTLTPGAVYAQSVASGTVEGTVTDATGGVIAGAKVDIRNPITGYTASTSTDASGVFRFSNLPFNNYHVEVSQQGFNIGQQDVSVRSLVPVPVRISLVLGAVSTTVNVEATSADLLESVPYAHNDVDISTLTKLPTLSPGSGLSDAIILSSPGVVADSNGFFHPLGDHAQTSFSIDGQPITDQQSKAFSTQIPVNAIQSMELVTGTPNAEFGDKTSLVVNATTRSGLGSKPAGGFLTEYGSFGTVSEETNLGFGSPRAGYFLAANGSRSGRFLDTPEFSPIHAKGNSGNFFNRLDFIPSNRDALHLNILVARNWFQIPNTLDQPGQDQRQKVLTFNIAPGYQHTFNPSTLLTVNPFVRRDRVNYYPSGDPFNDSPATLSQQRKLTNWGVRSDVSYASAKHNVKAGGQVSQTRLAENFRLGITDNLFNAVCTNAAGAPQAAPGIGAPAGCLTRALGPNPDFQPGLLALDLTRGGNYFLFADKGTINQYAVYFQDAITIGNLSLSPGVRIDRYDGLSKDTQAQPRMGISYLAPKSGTVLRAGYARTMETPYNENLLLSNSTGEAGLTDVFGAEGAEPLKPGHRNQYNVGFQQALGRYLQVDGDYFWKFTTNAYDFDVLFNTPVAFPISWKKSKLDGFSLRFSTPNIHGFQGYTTMGHTRARFFGPENGGLLFNSPVDVTVFRIDHDQLFQQTTNVRYQWKKDGPWISGTWRYDSGLVAGAVATIDDLRALSPAEQAVAGFDGKTAARIRLPEGEPDDDTNPARIAPRHLFDFGAGTDNLLMHSEGVKVSVKFIVSNIANKIALYNFQSTFSGTHFVAPRAYTGAIGFSF